MKKMLMGVAALVLLAVPASAQTGRTVYDLRTGPSWAPEVVVIRASCTPMTVPNWRVVSFTSDKLVVSC